MKAHWKQVADELATLLVALKDHPHDLDMEAFAKGFTRAASAYRASSGCRRISWPSRGR